MKFLQVLQIKITLSSCETYCRTLNRLLNVAEGEYFESKFISMKSDIKKYWKLLNDMLGRNRRSVHDGFVIDVGTEEGVVISKSF